MEAPENIWEIAVRQVPGLVSLILLVTYGLKYISKLVESHEANLRDMHKVTEGRLQDISEVNAAKMESLLSDSRKTNDRLADVVDNNTRTHERVLMSTERIEKKLDELDDAQR